MFSWMHSIVQSFKFRVVSSFFNSRGRTGPFTGGLQGTTTIRMLAEVEVPGARVDIVVEVPERPKQKRARILSLAEYENMSREALLELICTRDQQLQDM
jgi:hypothetical protein